MAHAVPTFRPVSLYLTPEELATWIQRWFAVYSVYAVAGRLAVVPLPPSVVNLRDSDELLGALRGNDVLYLCLTPPSSLTSIKQLPQIVPDCLAITLPVIEENAIGYISINTTSTNVPALTTWRAIREDVIRSTSVGAWFRLPRSAKLTADKQVRYSPGAEEMLRSGWTLLGAGDLVVASLGQHRAE